MVPSSRRETVLDGQLPEEFRRRDQSGFHVTPPTALVALILDIGEPVWACGPTAAALHRLEGFRLEPPFHLLIPRGRNARRIGHVVHTSNDISLLDRGRVSGLPCVTATRALIELAHRTPTDRLTIAVDSAITLGLTTDDFLHRRMGALRSSGRYGIPRLIEVLAGQEVIRGGQSWLERELLRLVAAAGLPAPLTQQVLAKRGDRLIRVDFRFAGTPVVVETLGYRPHRSPRQTMIDAERVNRLQLDGFQVYSFTYRQVVDDPDGVIAVLTAALAPYLASRHR